MSDGQGIRIKARFVKNWELHSTDRGVALIFGMNMELPDGRIETVGDSPLIISINQCRRLAANLLEMSAEMNADVGHAY